METKYKKLTLEQLDKTLKGFRAIATTSIPSKGWIKAVRTALGMTGTQLAKRLNTNKQRIARIEQDEKRGRVTLKTMQAVAEAMECEFVYGFVPRQSLEQAVRDQARRVAAKRMSRSNQMMRLEAQELSPEEKKQVLDELTDEIANEMPRNLWDE